MDFSISCLSGQALPTALATKIASPSFIVIKVTLQVKILNTQFLIKQLSVKSLEASLKLCLGNHIVWFVWRAWHAGCFTKHLFKLIYCSLRCFGHVFYPTTFVCPSNKKSNDMTEHFLFLQHKIKNIWISIWSRSLNKLCYTKRGRVYLGVGVTPRHSGVC
jgi:hypothetical protein